MEGKPIKRKKSLQNRQRLLKVAQALFAQNGYRGVSVDEIVGLAKMNKRMVYHYFGNKENLYREALVEAYQRLEDLELRIYEKNASPEEILRRVLKSYFRFLADNPDFVRLLLWENLNEGRAIEKQAHVLSKNPALTRLKEVIEDGIEAGTFRECLMVDHLLIHLIGLCFIYFSNRYTLSQALEIDLGSRKVQEQAMEAAFELVLHGIEARPGKAAKAARRSRRKAKAS